MSTRPRHRTPGASQPAARGDKSRRLWESGQAARLHPWPRPQHAKRGSFQSLRRSSRTAAVIGEPGANMPAGFVLTVRRVLADRLAVMVAVDLLARLGRRADPIEDRIGFA